MLPQLKFGSCPPGENKRLVFTPEECDADTICPFSSGKLVYERIFSMCVDNRGVLPGNVTAVPRLSFCSGVRIRFMSHQRLVRPDIKFFISGGLKLKETLFQISNHLSLLKTLEDFQIAHRGIWASNVTVHE